MAHFQVKLTQQAFERIVEGLATQPERVIDYPAGLSILPDRAEWLVHNVAGHFTRESPFAPRVVILGGRDPYSLRATLRRVPDRGASGKMEAFLGLEFESGTAHVGGFCRTSAGNHGLDSLRIVGPGMPSISLRNQPVKPFADSTRKEIWSRSIGVLGEQTWQRLTSTHIGIIGCGRSGSLAAFSLQRLGVENVTLIDPDLIEMHNMGEMQGVLPRDLGKRKAQVLADSMSRDPACSSRIKMVAESIVSLTALVASAKQCDFLFCGVDNAAGALLPLSSPLFMPNLCWTSARVSLPGPATSPSNWYTPSSRQMGA